MKAVCMHESGGADKLVYEDAPDPVIAANQVLVRVKACALNHLEVWSAMMPPGTRFPKPRI
ncbi:MAG TPA: alcohol dehydrogenase, partial [Dehalococcoidia bacterium]|nr:alcohol dehydrogenase [Dehalococcoidia bacterium]